jgi:hypothetical protein
VLIAVLTIQCSKTVFGTCHFPALVTGLACRTCRRCGHGWRWTILLARVGKNRHKGCSWVTRTKNF